MNYEEFKDVVKQEFMSYLPEKYRHLKLDIRPVEKVNVVKDGMNFLDMNQKTWATPTFYVQDMYDSYQDLGDYQEVFEAVAATVSKALRRPIVEANLDLKDAKENIVFQLINTEQNKEMLSSLPHREIHDLSIIYRWVVQKDEKGIKSGIVKKELMEKLGLDEEQIFKLAVENYKRLLVPTVRTMDEVMIETMVARGYTEDYAEFFVEQHSTKEKMWVISNETKINGAGSMLYDDVLQTVAKELNSNLYVIPSSVHEIIAIPVGFVQPHELANLVNEVNMNDVSLEERLSNQVYHYDKHAHKLSMATNTPLKRLDGLKDEPQPIYDTIVRIR